MPKAVATLYTDPNVAAEEVTRKWTRESKLADLYKRSGPVFAFSLPLFGAPTPVLLQRRNECCINLFLVNECGDIQFQSFFNEGSPYGKMLAEQQTLSIDYTKL